MRGGGAVKLKEDKRHKSRLEKIEEDEGYKNMSKTNLGEASSFWRYVLNEQITLTEFALAGK